MPKQSTQTGIGQVVSGTQDGEVIMAYIRAMLFVAIEGMNRWPFAPLPHPCSNEAAFVLSTNRTPKSVGYAFP
jgi:hypothetical protein